jgi:hypothetical protein
MTESAKLAERLRRLANPVDDSDWQAVLARADARPAPRQPPAARRRPFDRRSLRPTSALTAIAVVAVLALVAVLAAPPVSLATRIWHMFSGTPVSQKRLSPADWRVLSASNRGTPVSLRLHSLRGVGVEGITLVAQREGLRFYVIARTDGTRCYALGLAGSDSLFGQVSCPGPAFPSRSKPILDLSTWQTQPDTGQHIGRLVGFAADGIAAVALAAPDGTVHDRTTVEDNVYLRQEPTAAATAAVVAFDRGGHLAYTCRTCIPPVPSFTGIPDAAAIAAKRLLTRFDTHSGATVSTWIAPTKSGDGRCYWVEIGANPIASGCPAPSNDVMTGGLSSTGPTTLLIGETSAAVASVRVRYADGNQQIVQPVRGLVVAEILPKQLEPGHEATELIAENSAGKGLATITLRPAQEPGG